MIVKLFKNVRKKLSYYSYEKPQEVKVCEQFDGEIKKNKIVTEIAVLKQNRCR